MTPTVDRGGQGLSEGRRVPEGEKGGRNFPAIDVRAEIPLAPPIAETGNTGSTPSEKRRDHGPADDQG
jgi:hypothetical protein